VPRWQPFHGTVNSKLYHQWWPFICFYRFCLVLFLIWIGGPGRTSTDCWQGPREQPINHDYQKKHKGKKKRWFSKLEPKPLLLTENPSLSFSRVRAPGLAQCRRVTTQTALLPLALRRYYGKTLTAASSCAPSIQQTGASAHVPLMITHAASSTGDGIQRRPSPPSRPCFP
jgi:hypothetical protein